MCNIPRCFTTNRLHSCVWFNVAEMSTGRLPVQCNVQYKNELGKQWIKPCCSNISDPIWKSTTDIYCMWWFSLEIKNCTESTEFWHVDFTVFKKHCFLFILLGSTSFSRKSVTIHKKQLSPKNSCKIQSNVSWLKWSPHAEILSNLKFQD